MNEDIHREILTELRSLKRLTQWLLGLLVVAGVVGMVLVAKYQRAQPQSADNRDPWASISAALDRGDNREALSLAQSYVARQPGNYYTHVCLGFVYVALSDFTNAEAAYARAVELYPCEDNEKALAAVRKRLARERAK